MAEADYDSILPEIAPYAPNCPEPVMVNAVRNAVIDFCTVTGWLTQDLSPVTLAANTPTYEIEADDDDATSMPRVPRQTPKKRARNARKRRRN